MQNRLFILGLAIALSIAGAAQAQEPTNASPVTGRVVVVDANAKTFAVETPNGRINFKTDDRTMYMRRDTHMNLSELKVGEQIRVTYSGRDSERIAANVVTVDSGMAYRSTADSAGTMGGTSMADRNRPSGTMGQPGLTGTTDMTGGKTVTGRVTSVDVAGRNLTIDTSTGSQTFPLGVDTRVMARGGSTDLGSIYTGDRVRVQLANDSRTANRIDFVSGETGDAGTMTSNRRELPRTASPLPLMGLAGFAMIGIALALRALRLRAA